MLLIEMQCRDWEHNRVNAGVIELSQKSFPEEEVKLYAEDAHIKNLRDFVEKQHIRISSQNINFADWRTDSYRCRDKYAGLIAEIIKKEPTENTVIFLSSNKGIIKAAEQVSKENLDKKFYVILHAALEEVVHEYHSNMRQIVYTWYLKFRNIFGGSYCAELSMRECINECISHNYYFVLYAPKYKEYLTNNINSEILERFIFLHHPLYEVEEYNKPLNNKLVIGIYGQAVNENAYDIINIYNQRYDKGHVKFLVITKPDNSILMLKNVVKMFDQDNISNEELELARKQMDCILIPYDCNKYKVTASGILCDALSEEIPVMMLDSPLLEFYNNYKIGELRRDVDSMAHTIADIAADVSKRNVLFEKCRQAERELKKIVLQDNIRTFREMVR